MIALQDVTRLQRTDNGNLVLLSNATEQFKRNERVGILAAPGTGKSSIARMLAGVEKPDSGRIFRQGKVSWPIGFAGGFHPELSAAENITYLSNLVGQDPIEAISFCIEFAGFADSIRQKLKTFSPGQRAAIAYSFSLSVACDMYIADEVIGIGDPEMRLRCRAMLDRRLEKAGLVFLSKNPTQLKNRCTRFFVLIDSKLVPCEDMDVGVAALALAKKRNPIQPLTAETRIEASHE